jgi:hypothetical protein
LKLDKEVQMQNYSELIKSLVRPFIIIWGFTVYGICIILQIEVPLLLAGLVAAVILEYFGERAILRLKE